jgi:hypothetical protein
VTHDLIARSKSGRSRLPAARQPVVEELVGIRLMIPHGDRRDGAESGGIEAEIDRAVRKNDVVRVFVLRHDLGHLDSRRLAGAPRKYIGECVAVLEGLLDLADALRRDGTDGAH